jgi:hypothetical protein
VSGKSKQKVYNERASDPSRVCLYLPAGKFNARVESRPEKVFLPETLVLEVPSAKEFTFREFTGLISGKVNCPLVKDSKCDVSVQLRSKISGEVLSEQQSKGGAFQFRDLGSGEYTLEVIHPTFCWKSNTLDVKLKSSNIENLEFQQTGFSLTISSTHDTEVKLSTSQKKLIEKFHIKRSQPKSLCLKEASDAFLIEPIGCHVFEQNVYTFKPGKDGQNLIELIARAHEYSGVIETNARVTDLQVKRNGELLDSTLTVTETKGMFLHEVKFTSEAGKGTTLQFFSYGFIFEPNVYNFETGTDCEYNIFRITGQKSHVIKGTLTPALGKDQGSRNPNYPASLQICHL